jgi:long-chain acyl-CoA synthetase
MRVFSLGFPAALLLAASTFAAEIEGVKLADRVQVGESELALNGAGVRTRFFVRVYVGALYLQKKSARADAVLGDGGTKRIAMHMLREVSAARLYAGLDEGIRDNHTAEQVAQFGPQMKQFQGIFDAVKAARAGDTFFLDYTPGSGTRVIVNGETKGTIAGDEFHRALLRIWLGAQPVDASLKKAMLGG